MPRFQKLYFLTLKTLQLHSQCVDKKQACFGWISLLPVISQKGQMAFSSLMMVGPPLPAVLSEKHLPIKRPVTITTKTALPLQVVQTSNSKLSHFLSCINFSYFNLVIGLMGPEF